MQQNDPIDKESEVDALRRVIDYAKDEAVRQRQSFTAYLLALALHSLDPVDVAQRPS